MKVWDHLTVYEEHSASAMAEVYEQHWLRYFAGHALFETWFLASRMAPRVFEPRGESGGWQLSFELWATYDFQQRGRTVYGTFPIEKADELADRLNSRGRTS